MHLQEEEEGEGKREEEAEGEGEGKREEEEGEGSGQPSLLKLRERKGAHRESRPRGGRREHQLTAVENTVNEQHPETGDHMTSHDIT